MTKNNENKVDQEQSAKDAANKGQAPVSQNPKEIGGQAGPEPTRYGDWEKNGRCSDF